MSETVLTTISGKTLVKATKNGPSSYSTGGVYERIDTLLNADTTFNLNMSGGYVVEQVPDGYTGNAIKYKVYWQTGASGDPLTEVASGTALTGETIEAVVLGD